MKTFPGLAFALVMATGAAAPALAQDGASGYLPDAAALGTGWAQIATVPVSENLDPSFEEGLSAVYGGPDGARAIVTVFTVADGMTAIRQSWEVGNTIFDSYRSEIDYGYQSSREDEVAVLPLPAGCADARRLYGVDTVGFQQFPVGLTLCAADPNLIVMAYASGTVNGLTENQASDFVVQTALEPAGGGSPATVPDTE